MISPSSFFTNQIVFIKKNTQDNINLVHNLYSMKEQTQTKQTQTKEYDHEIINTMYGSACLKCELEDHELDNKDSCEVRSL